jgi:DNA-binding SARP family transcriptional activator
LRRQLAGALTMLAKSHCSQGQAASAIPYAQRSVVLDPLGEASHGQLMQIYRQVGEHNAALKQYQICEQILRNELGVDPKPQTRVIYRQIRSGSINPC